MKEIQSGVFIYTAEEMIEDQASWSGESEALKILD